MKAPGPIAVVTGAGRGIGRSTALALAREGFAVALWSRNKGNVTRVARELQAAGATALALVVNVADAESVHDAARQTLTSFGVPQVLVNNAGIVKRASIERTTEAVWDEVLNESCMLQASLQLSEPLNKPAIARPSGDLSAL
jgi:3-oxoacyl-[acyl-carrier protein] reductase